MSLEFSALVGIPKNANLGEKTLRSFAVVSMFFPIMITAKN